MTIEEKLNERRDELAQADFSMGFSGNFNGGFNTLSPSWLGLEKASKMTLRMLLEIDYFELDAADAADILTCIKALKKALAEADKFLATREVESTSTVTK